MASEKRLIYMEDAIALFEQDIAENKVALRTAYHGDKETIRAEMNGMRAAISILKHHASHGGTVDAVEVVHGRWVHHYNDSGEPIDDKWYCSECHMCNGHKRTWYCPNCGAKMDGDGNG